MEFFFFCPGVMAPKLLFTTPAPQKYFRLHRRRFCSSLFCPGYFQGSESYGLKVFSSKLLNKNTFGKYVSAGCSKSTHIFLMTEEEKNQGKNSKNTFNL